MSHRVYSPGGYHGHIYSADSATAVLCGATTTRYWSLTPDRKDRVTTCSHCDRLATLPPLHELIEMCRTHTNTVTARWYGLHHNFLADYIQRHQPRANRSTSDVAPPIPDQPVGGEWVDRGLCVGGDPELWVGDSHIDRKVAALICKDCPVRLECAKDALDRDERWGVWGGIDMGVKDRPALGKAGAR